MPLQTLLNNERKYFSEEFSDAYIGGEDKREIMSWLALHDQKIITAVIGMCEGRKNEDCRTDLGDNPNSPEAWVRGKVYGRNEALDDLQQALKKV